MALKKTLAQRLFGISKTTNLAQTNCRISSPCSAANSAILNNRSNINNDSSDDRIFRRYLNTVPKSPSHKTFFPTGEKLSERIREMGIGWNRVRLDGLVPPPAPAAMPPEEVAAEEGLTVMDVRKVMKVSQLEKVKERLRMVEKDCVSYNEFLEICGKDCESVESGLEFAEILDQSGNVIVLGNIVFLRPDKVVKAIQSLMPTPSPLGANDPRIKELEELETQKERIDKKAELLVRRELWCGLGYLIVQTSAFMRLTFWELTWDVMEPVCFYVTSMYFMGGYAFFLRTSKEPSFEGFFQSRFVAKQKRLMKAQNFDLKRYNDLKKAFYPQLPATRESNVSFSS